MTDEHYTIAQAITMNGVYKQEYDLVVAFVGDVKSYEKHDKSGTITVQDLIVSDGTGRIKYSIFSPAKIYNIGMGLHVEGVYIKAVNGYYSLKVAQPQKGGVIKFSETTNIIASPPNQTYSAPLQSGGITDETKQAVDTVFNWMFNKLSKEDQSLLFVSYPDQMTYINDNLMEDD